MSLLALISKYWNEWNVIDSANTNEYKDISLILMARYALYSLYMPREYSNIVRSTRTQKPRQRNAIIFFKSCHRNQFILL